MKKLLLIAFALATPLAVPSCSLTPEQKAQVLSFTQAGVQTFVDSGALKPGYSVLITGGVGLITSLANPVAAPKEVPLEKLGLDTAVENGTVQQGDTVVIRENDVVVVSPPGPANPLLPVP